MPTLPTLLADIGGTNARFAISHSEQPWFSQVESMLCANYPTIFAAIDAYLKRLGCGQLGAICIAVAGPIQDQAVSCLNNSWSFSTDELRARYAANQVSLINDFEAIAYSLPHLTQHKLTAIGADHSLALSADFNLAVIGPGSGLGVSGVRQTKQGLVTLSSEGGHVGFAPQSDLQNDIHRHLQAKLGRVSNERVLSGPGLVNIYESLCSINKTEFVPLTAAEITLAAHQDSDPTCVQTVSLFFEILGQLAGDTVLALGAYDGVYIAGGIVKRYPSLLQASEFRRGFENKGRYRLMMQGIPSWLVNHDNPGLLGASIFAKTKLG